MTEDQYRELFRDLGIEARELRKVLRYGGLPRRVYFNRSRDKDLGIYFSARAIDEEWYPINLWERIDPHRVQQADQERLNAVPRPGMAAEAFQNLVSHWQNAEVE